jgi:two-component system, sensor histidine kinase LadS
MNLKSCFLIILLLPGFFCHGQQKIVDYQGEAIRSVGFDDISYLIASDSTATLNQALANFKRGRFTLNKLPALNLGIAKENYWVSFSIRNTTLTETSAYVLLENPRLNEVDVFVLKHDSVQSTFKLGDNFPFAIRPLTINEFVIPLTISSDDEVSVFLLIKHKGNTLQMPVSIRSMNALLQKTETDYLQAGLVTGILAIAFFFGLFFLINTRDILFIYYSGYMITAALWVWTTEGFAFQFFWPTAPELATRLGPGISAVSACFFIANCLQFTRPYDQSTKLRRVLQGILIFIVIWASTPFLPFIPITEKTMSVYLNVYFTLNIIIALLLFAYLLRMVLRGYQVVIYFFFAVITTMICSTLVVLKGGGVITLSFSSSTVMSAGYIVELILMTAGITRQFYLYRKEKEETLLAYLEQQKTITQKILETQEGERRRIGRELHDDIGAGLTQISLMSEVAKNYSAASKSNLNELEDIALTSRALVQSMGEIIWALHPDNKTLNQLLIYLREQMNKLLEYSGKDFSINFPQLDHEIPLSNVHLRNISLIVKESVNNAIKYSQADSLTINCQIKQNSVSFEIIDNGQGMDLPQIKPGNGLVNMKKRASEINGVFTLKSTPGQGTQCHLEITLK